MEAGCGSSRLGTEEQRRKKVISQTHGPYQTAEPGTGTTPFRPSLQPSTPLVSRLPRERGDTARDRGVVGRHAEPRSPSPPAPLRLLRRQDASRHLLKQAPRAHSATRATRPRRRLVRRRPVRHRLSPKRPALPLSVSPFGFRATTSSPPPGKAAKPEERLSEEARTLPGPQDGRTPRCLGLPPWIPLFGSAVVRKMSQSGGGCRRVRPRAGSMPPEKHLGLSSFLPKPPPPPSSVKDSTSGSGSISGTKRKSNECAAIQGQLVPVAVHVPGSSSSAGKSVADGSGSAPIQELLADGNDTPTQNQGAAPNASTVALDDDDDDGEGEGEGGEASRSGKRQKRCTSWVWKYFTKKTEIVEEHGKKYKQVWGYCNFPRCKIRYRAECNHGTTGFSNHLKVST